jgi:hypothetical protein
MQLLSNLNFVLIFFGARMQAMDDVCASHTQNNSLSTVQAMPYIYILYAWRLEQWQKKLEASDLFDSDLQTGVTVRQFEVWNINLT